MGSQPGKFILGCCTKFNCAIAEFSAGMIRRLRLDPVRDLVSNKTSVYVSAAANTEVT